MPDIILSGAFGFVCPVLYIIVAKWLFFNSQFSIS
uniref:Uncharacterized protein n=2 Tax=unclassified Ackermannviridae TaxID=2175602 RepID=A0A8S5UK67_9CAUD|nr:MAG TPA: hypothetical protein [Ackermannviridae sp. ctQad106]DAF94885.1 MAG TPA: hypothetical protein [Ackermannviridae sp. ctkHJ36]